MKTIATARCVGTVKRCEINYSRHMGGRIFCWTDVTREFLCIIPRDTFMLWAKNLRQELPIPTQRTLGELGTEADAKRVMDWIKGKEVKIIWQVTEGFHPADKSKHGGDGLITVYRAYINGLAHTDQESKRLAMGRKRNATRKR